MTFLAPAAFALSLLAGPIVVMYMLRSRRMRTPVSSTLLWLPGERNLSASMPWQPLRFSLLLALQLLALLLLLLAVARPARATALPLGEHTVLILDASASMQAAEPDGRTRIEIARAKAAEAVDQLSPGKRMSVIAAGPEAEVVLSGSSDRRALLAAINGVEATDGTADAEAAFALGASLETADTPTVLLFYSDGAISPEARESAPSTLVHVQTGTPLPNVAVERIAVTPSGAGWDAFVRVSNEGAAAVDAALEFVAGETVVARVPVRVEPRSGVDLTAALPAIAGGAVGARLTGARARGGDATVNALAADDQASTLLDRGSGLKVLLVTKGNVFLEAFVGSLPGAELTVADEPVPPTGQSLAIYDGIAPPAEPAVPSIVIAAPGGAPGVTATGKLELPIVTFVQPREPILDQVDLSALAIRVAQQVSAPRMDVLAAAGDDPMLLAGVPGGTRMAYVAFALSDSNLPVQVAFPLLFGNLVTWLTRGDAPDQAELVAGDELPLSIPGGATSFTVRGPGGTTTRPVDRDRFEDTARAGIYRIAYEGADGTLGEESFALGIPAGESNLDPVTVGGGGAGGLASDRSLRGLRAYGPGLLALVLVVLLVEWWEGYGRPRRMRRAAGAAA
ncbi:MAG TPA: VWA domain-containing protein [Actinomycetota bacterium]